MVAVTACWGLCVCMCVQAYELSAAGIWTAREVEEATPSAAVKLGLRMVEGSSQ